MCLLQILQNLLESELFNLALLRPRLFNHDPGFRSDGWKVWGWELLGWSLELKSPAGLECPVTHQKTDGNVSSVFTQYKRLLELWDRYKIIIHKSRGDQFLWNIIWDLCWLWAIWQYLKKIWADYEQFLKAVFSCFHMQKNILFF